ncbi:MAG: hypothetical protein ACLTDV_13745 [Eubacterium sp.]
MLWICHHEGETEDVFIPESSTNGAIQDDVVQIALVPSSGKRREGKVVKIGTRTENSRWNL